MALKAIAEQYFSNLNPIAARICQDMDQIKSSYEELWETLTEDQQKQILSESIIKPEVSIKYSSSETNKTNEEYAVKLIIDDNCSYRDEHSGPFSFRTASQRNLTIFDQQKPRSNVVNNVKPKPKKNSIVYVEDNVLQVEVEEAPNELPRTGLDFLDNW